MDPNYPTPPVAPAPVAAAPVAPVAPAPAPYIPPAPAAESYADGGIIGKLDLVEMGFLIAGAFCIFHIIDYYRKKAKEEKANQASMQQLQEGQEQLQMNFNTLMTKLRRGR